MTGETGGCVVIGLGNPLRADDGVGIRVAALVRKGLPLSTPVTVSEVHAGGIRLLDALSGFDRAIIVDAMITGNYPPGTARRLAMDDLPTTRNSWSSHDMDLATALELGRLTGLRLPAELEIIGIEAATIDGICDLLTPAVAAAAADVAADIIQHLEHCRQTDGQEDGRPL